jgi:fused signal recognition particle receptor
MAATETDSRQEAIAKFAEVATSEQARKVEEVDQQVHEVVGAALALEVRTTAEAQAATEVLSTIAVERKRSEEARQFLVRPLNEHVKAINARFKTAAEPLDEADGVVRRKLLAYRAEQERVRAAEQARLDAERVERERQEAERRAVEEAEARAAREVAAREAAKAEAEAKAAQKRRQEQLAREASDLARTVAGMDDDTLRHTATERTDIGAAARDELAQRRTAREANEAVAAAHAREEAAREAEQAVKDAPAVEVPETQLAPVAPLSSSSGSVASRKRWVAEVVDATKVPREYWAVDQKKINQAVRDGVREIPGVRIQQVDELAVRTAR